MKTIAIWYEPTNPSTDHKKIELHFNLWKLPNGGAYQRFLDIGIKIQEPADVKELCLYFPFVIVDSDFEDIVGQFIKDSSLVSAIFNENYTVSSNSQTKSYPIKNTKGEEVFDIYETSAGNRKREEKFNGTVFRLHSFETNRPIYFRLRVKGPYVESLSAIQETPNAFIQSAFSKTEMIDFRVNEARDLSKDLLAEIAKQSEFTFEKYHFFFVCSYSEDILSSHKQYNNCRNLENYRWGSYVGNEKLKDQTFLAYHWKEEKKNNINVLIRTKFEKNNVRTIIKYLLVSLFIAVVFSLISAFTFDYLQHLLKHPSHESPHFNKARVCIQNF